MQIDILIIILKIIAIIIAITIHEFTKSLVAYKLGDVSVKNDGRLSLNPLAHFEPLGFLLFLITGYGWGKPLDVSALYYKNRKKGILLTYTIPIVVSFVFGILFIFIFLLNATLHYNYFLNILLQFLFMYNLQIAIFNLIPIYPLCGEKILMTLLPSNKAFEYSKYQKALQIIVIILLLGGFLTRFLDNIISTILTLILFTI